MNNKYLIMLNQSKFIIIFIYTATHSKHIEIPLRNMHDFRML